MMLFHCGPSGSGGPRGEAPDELPVNPKVRMGLHASIGSELARCCSFSPHDGPVLRQTLLGSGDNACGIVMGLAVGASRGAGHPAPYAKPRCPPRHPHAASCVLRSLGLRDTHEEQRLVHASHDC